MPVQLLIHAINHSKARKGTVQDIRDITDETAPRWDASVLPNYIVLTISDATMDDVTRFKDSWKNGLSYTLLNSNAQGRRYQISVSRKLVQEVGIDRAFRQDARDYLVETYGAVLVSYTPAQGQAVFDIPNTDWAALRADMLDLFEEQLDSRRYYFEPADVDTVAANGGLITLTKSVAVAKLVDKDEFI